MPNRKTNHTDDKQRVKLSREIADLLPQLTYGEKLAVCMACGKHEDTLTRYCSEVKKIPTANKMIAEMRKVLAARGVSAALVS